MGTRHWLYEPRAVERELVTVAGSFAPASTGAPTTVRGTGFTVARTGVGTFRLTLDRVWPSLVSAVGTLQLATADHDRHVQISAVDLASKTVDLKIMDVTAGASADVAANADNRVNFLLLLKRSGF